MPGIKNRGSQTHKVKTKYDRTTGKKLDSVNEYESCVECIVCHNPFDPAYYGEEVCQDCGGANGR